MASVGTLCTLTWERVCPPVLCCQTGWSLTHATWTTAKMAAVRAWQVINTASAFELALSDDQTSPTFKYV